MKYFTETLWRGVATGDPDWRKVFERRQRSYKRQLQQLLPRLSHDAVRFFTQENAHGNRIVGVCIYDGDSEQGRRRMRRVAGEPPAWVELLAEAPRVDHYAIHHLRYFGVQRFDVEFPGRQPVVESGGFGTWAVDELTGSGEGVFNHTILFSAGAKVKVHFQRFEYQRLKARRD